MRALDRKLARDLWSLRSQVASIALVVACGIAAFVACISTHGSLLASRDRYYAEARFAHVFATAKRAPLALVDRLAAIPGVLEAEGRIARDTQLSIEGVDPPMVARLVGYDFDHPPGLHRLALQAGRWPMAGARREAVVNRRFLEARGLALGATVRVLLNGRQERYTLVGSALSPEFVYATRGGGLPDDEWFAVLWVDGPSLAAAYDMEGAFDSALLRLAPGASVPAAIDAADAILAPYGGLGAIGRADQPSNRILSQEINQQRIFGIVMPAIFFAVAAFIVNAVLHRQVAAQRGDIAALKSLGYDDRRIAAHYLAFATAIVLLGLAIGVLVGTWLGRAMTQLYVEAFQFPQLGFRVSPPVLAVAAVLGLASASAGALAALRSVVRLRPAEALRPPAPEAFRALLLERLGAGHWLTPAQRMVMRNLERRPLRALVTVAGIAGAAAILIAGSFWQDSLDWFLDVQFSRMERGQVQVAFPEPVARDEALALGRLPGVIEAEADRSIPAMLRAGHRSYRTAVTALAEGSRLRRIVDADLEARAPPVSGAFLSARLAERLGLRPGDTVRVELLDGRRAAGDVRVSGLVDDMAGMNAWMSQPELARLSREGDVASSAQLRVDRADEAGLMRALKEIPGAAVVISTRAMIATFLATLGKNVLFFTAILTGFAAVIAVGVVYNNARIQLAERAWELASLRVLGFTRREVSTLLLAELALEIAVAVPAGALGGYGLASLLLALMPHEVVHFPTVIFPRTYFHAAMTVLAAGVASGLVVRRRIDQLDLVAVLKTRE